MLATTKENIFANFIMHLWSLYCLFKKEVIFHYFHYFFIVLKLLKHIYEHYQSGWVKNTLSNSFLSIP